jgi:hypothetical protein
VSVSTVGAGALPSAASAQGPDDAARSELEPLGRANRNDADREAVVLFLEADRHDPPRLRGDRGLAEPVTDRDRKRSLLRTARGRIG